MEHSAVRLRAILFAVLVASVLQGCALAARDQTLVAIREPGQSTYSEPVKMHDTARKLYVYAALSENV